MDKRKFLEELQRQLSDLTNEERREALEYYEEYFADAGEENEEDVISSLGTPEQVAEQIKAGLHKEEDGMFTENGYREKIESDNPPEIYGKKAEKQKNKGSRAWNRDRQNCTGYHANESNGTGYHDSTQGGYGYGGQQDRKTDGMSGGMIALIVVLCIFASPVILGLGAGLFGIVLGILGAVFGVIVAFFAIVVALLAAGIGLFLGGFPLLLYSPFTGMICIAAGCFLIALFLLCMVLLVTVCSKFFPWLIREVESFGKYLSRKWSERKGRGEAI